MHGHEQANIPESPISRIFGGKSCSVVRATNQLDTVTVENWRSLQLDIQVRLDFLLRAVPHTTYKLFAQPDSVHTVQDALAFLARPQAVQANWQVGQSSSSEPSRQLLLDSEMLPPVLVLHLKRFLYDMASDGINKISKPVQFAPELEIAPGTILPVVSPVLVKAKNHSSRALSV